MKKILILFIVILFEISPPAISAEISLKGLKPGSPSPGFRVRTIEGMGLTGGNLRGKILILTFWKKDQIYSEGVLMDLEKIFQEFKDKGVMVLGINGDKSSVSEIRKVKTGLKLSFFLSGDRDLNIYARFGVMVLPTTYIIGPDGILAYQRSTRPKDFFVQIHARTRLLLGEISKDQIEAEIRQNQVRMDTGSRTKAKRFLNLGRTLLKVGMFDKAKEALENSIQLDPTLLDSHILMARIHIGKKEVEKAGEKIEEINRIMMTAESGAKDLKEASTGRKGRNKSLEKNQDRKISAETYNIRMGKVFEKQNMPERALGAYEKALEILLEKR